MSDAERVAARLAFEFLRDGKFAAAHGPVELSALAQLDFLVAAAGRLR